MAISWNTGTATSGGSGGAASYNITIPAGVLQNDVVFVVFSGLGSSSAETVQASSTGTSPSIVQSSQDVGISGTHCAMALFSFVASASDAGKVITGSLVSGDSVNWAAAIGAWSGASTSSPIDVSGVTANAGSGNSLTCPSETTGVANDWDLQIVGAALGGSSYTGPGGFTQRESVADGSSGSAAIIYDSNGSVGGSGTSIGGGVFTNAGHDNWWAGWTVGLAPSAGTPHTATASLTITPSFAVKKAEGHVQAMTVTPAFSLKKAEAHKQSLTVTPVFSALGVKNFGKGGTPDRHHRRSWNPR
jgi:hypothetical protein